MYKFVMALPSGPDVEVTGYKGKHINIINRASNINQKGMSKELLSVILDCIVRIGSLQKEPPVVDSVSERDLEKEILNRVSQGGSGNVSFQKVSNFRKDKVGRVTDVNCLTEDYLRYNLRARDLFAIMVAIRFASLERHPKYDVMFLEHAYKTKSGNKVSKKIEINLSEYNPIEVIPEYASYREYEDIPKYVDLVIDEASNRQLRVHIADDILNSLSVLDQSFSNRQGDLAYEKLLYSQRIELITDEKGVRLDQPTLLTRHDIGELPVHQIQKIIRIIQQELDGGITPTFPLSLPEDHESYGEGDNMMQYNILNGEIAGNFF